MPPKQRLMSSMTPTATSSAPASITLDDAQKVAEIAGWKHDRAAHDMLELLYGVQITAAILTRPPDRAINRDLLVMRKQFHSALEASSWAELRAIHSVLVAGYQARHIEGQTVASAAADLLRSDLLGLQRLVSAVDFAIEFTGPRRGPRRVEAIVHILVRELIWTYKRFIGGKFRGVRAAKTFSPGPDFVRAVLALLVPTAKRSHIDRAMRQSNLDQLTAIYGQPHSAAIQTAETEAAKGSQDQQAVTDEPQSLLPTKHLKSSKPGTPTASSG
jgi:hypothetical protein